MRRFGIYLFVLFLGIFPLQTVYLLRETIIGGEKWQYGTIGIYAADTLLVLILGWYGARYFVHRRTRSNFEGQRHRIARLTGTQKQLFLMPFASEQTAKKKFVFALQYVKQLLVKRDILCIGFIFWAGLSILWAPDQVLAGYFVVKLLLALSVFWIAHSLDEHEVNWAIIILCIGAVLESILGIGQFLTQSTFVSTWLGMSGHEAWQAGTSVLKNDTGRWLRSYGTFPHPNMLGGYLGAILVLGMGYFSHRVLSTRVQWVVWGGGMILLLGLFLTFSRTAWVGTAIGRLVLSLVSVVQVSVQSSRKSAVLKNEGEKRIARVFMVFCVATLIFSWVLRETVLPRFDGRVIESEHSVSERVQSLADAWEVISKKNIWLGVGAGNFTAAVIQAQPERPIWSVQPVHNVFVLVFVELGVVGAVLCILYFISRIWSALQEKHNLFFAVSGVLFLSLCLDHWLWTTHFGILFFCLMLGLSAKRMT